MMGDFVRPAEGRCRSLKGRWNGWWAVEVWRAGGMGDGRSHSCLDKSLSERHTFPTKNPTAKLVLRWKTPVTLPYYSTARTPVLLLGLKRGLVWWGAACGKVFGDEGLGKCSRLQLKCDGTRWRTGGEVKGKLANGVGSQYPSHYLGTWCIQHYYRRCAHVGCQ